MALHDVQNLQKSNNEKRIEHLAKCHKIELGLHDIQDLQKSDNEKRIARKWLTLGLVHVVEDRQIETFCLSDASDFLHELLVASLLSGEDPQTSTINARSSAAQTILSLLRWCPARNESVPLMLIVIYDPICTREKRWNKVRTHLQFTSLGINDLGIDNVSAVMDLPIFLVSKVVNLDIVPERGFLVQDSVLSRYTIVLRLGKIRSLRLLLYVPWLRGKHRKIEVLDTVEALWGTGSRNGTGAQSDEHRSEHCRVRRRQLTPGMVQMRFA
mmetsp:Transcript_133571/g.260093  ORF Transcript_133571/g.260093 Transcript_133571/m.260093 type:complete len:270 (+) Transcript_133571:242-1051(+)